MDSAKPWYLSKRFWTTAMMLLSSVSALAGYTIDAGTQQQLVTYITDIADSVTGICAIVLPLLVKYSTAKITLTKASADAINAAPKT